MLDLRMRKVIGSGQCVVDLGCGSGWFLGELTTQFKKRIGLDISKRRLEIMANGKVDDWEFCETDLNGAFPLGDSIADAVVANQVIEHIIDPLKFTREIRRVLRPGGRCVITTPNIRYLKSIAHLLFSGYGPRTAGGNTLDGVWDDGHLHYFTHLELRELVAYVGFCKVNSSALIDLSRAGRVRRFLDRRSTAWPIREFLSGNILLWAEK